MRIKALAASCLLAGLTTFTAAAALACPDGKEKDKTAVKENTPAPNAKIATAAFHVTGMHCSGCSDKVKSTLAKADGVLKVDVKLADGRVVVSYDANKISSEKIAKLMTEAGYPAAAEA
jgi:copper chaperone CopZ